MSCSEASPTPQSNPHATLAAVYRQAVERDPRSFAFGYLAGDLHTGAYGAFLWFASADEMLDFLCTTEVALLQFDEQDATRIAASLRRAIGTTRDVARLDRHALSAALEGWSQILWIGRFVDLCEKGGSFEKSHRSEFRAVCGLGMHAGPIADDEIDAFIAFMTAPEEVESAARPRSPSALTRIG